MIKGMLPEPTACSASRCRPATWWWACSAAAADGYSGISANPALGAAVDRLVRHGGTAILSETPEIYGGEHLLTRRAVSRRWRQAAGRIQWWEDLHARNGRDGQQPVGRQQGRRADHDPREVAGRGHRQGRHHPWSTSMNTPAGHARGFVFMDTPGYDPVSATGQVAGGANLICFTTGRGSAYGCAPSPSR
jgi:altronate hydrolase